MEVAARSRDMALRARALRAGPVLREVELAEKWGLSFLVEGCSGNALKSCSPEPLFETISVEP